MKANLSFSEIYSHEAIRKYFFRSQAWQTVELMFELSGEDVRKLLSILDNATEEMSIDYVEEMFYSYSAEDCAAEFGIELQSEEDAE